MGETPLALSRKRKNEKKKAILTQTYTGRRERIKDIGKTISMGRGGGALVTNKCDFREHPIPIDRGNRTLGDRKVDASEAIGVGDGEGTRVEGGCHIALVKKGVQKVSGVSHWVRAFLNGGKCNGGGRSRPRTG